MPLQIRRGSEAERLLMTVPLAPGELLYADGRLFVGDGQLPGGVLVTGYSDNDAKDATAEMLADNTHSGISFSYNSTTKLISATVDLSNYTGILKADAFKGSVFADDGSTLGGQPLVDAISGTFNGNLVGNVTGNVTGNVSGNVTGNVTGNITGNITGDIETNIIDSANSSAITVIPSTVFNSDVTVENDLFVESIILNGVKHTSIGEKLFPIPQDGETTDHYLTFVDNISGQAIVKTDGNLRYNPSTRYITTTGFIGSLVSAPTINTSNIATQNISSNGVLTLSSALSNAGRSTALVSIGSTTTNGRFRLTAGTFYTGIAALFDIDQHHDSADVNNFQFNRSRGTALSPTAVQNGDDIADIAFAGSDGISDNLTRASISVTVNGAISTGVIPMKITLNTSTNGSGTPVVAVTVDEKQQTTFAGAITLATYADAAARDLAIPTPTAGMMVYISGTGKFQGYNGSTTTWNDLN
jgi:trimeric autotransporter adhesin